MAEKYSTKLYPKDIEKVSKESIIRKHLALKREVAVGPNGWILDVWDPVTQNLYDDDGNYLGTRDKPFPMPDRSEHRVQLAETILPGQADEWTRSDVVGRLLWKGYHVTRDLHREIIDVWDPETKTIRDIHGNEVGKRDTPYVEYREKEVKNPLRHTYKPADMDQFAEGGDMWEALARGPNMQVTLDDKGFIIDIWDPDTGKLYDMHGGDLGTRTDPYPSDNNMGNIKAQIDIKNAEIAALRAALRWQKGSARAATNAALMGLLRERGRLVWLHGRLLGRKRRMDVAYHKRMIKSTTKQK